MPSQPTKHFAVRTVLAIQATSFEAARELASQAIRRADGRDVKLCVDGELVEMQPTQRTQ